MAKENHIITIKNFQPGELVTHELVILKGTIENRNCPNTLPSLKINNINYWIGPKNTFKALVALTEGHNNLNLNYCCQECTFDIVFENSLTEKRVKPLYVLFNGHNGSFQAPEGMQNDKDEALARIDLNCKLIQSVLSEKLHEHRLQHNTFQLESAELFFSNININQAKQVSQSELFHMLAIEIEKSSFGSPDVKHIAFISGTHYNGDKYKDWMKHEDLIEITDCYIALGRGNLAVIHTGCLYTWPSQLENVNVAFSDQTPVNRNVLLDDSNYKGTWGACYSTTLGSTFHELCHTFDLGHADHGIMSRGFDDIRDVFLRDTPEAIDADSRKGAHGITDSTQLHKSGAYILRYHKWISREVYHGSYILTFDNSFCSLRSSIGIKVIEIRAGDEQMMVKNWVFTTPKMTFCLDLSDIQQPSSLFVMDRKGNILQRLIQ